MGENMEEEVKVKKHRKKSLIASIMVGVLVGVAFTLAVLWKPVPELTRVEGYALEQANVFVVEATVKNNGREGYVVVYAEINCTSKFERQEQTVYLLSGETKDVMFTFNVTQWTEVITYRVWAD
jgi:cytochrome c oxidase assembly protein Cox11